MISILSYFSISMYLQSIFACLFMNKIDVLKVCMLNAEYSFLLFCFFFAVFFILDFRFNTELFCSVHVLIQSASNGELKACSRIFTVYISEN